MHVLLMILVIFMSKSDPIVVASIEPESGSAEISMKACQDNVKLLQAELQGKTAKTNPDDVIVDVQGTCRFMAKASHI